MKINITQIVRFSVAVCLHLGHFIHCRHCVHQQRASLYNTIQELVSYRSGWRYHVATTAQPRLSSCPPHIYSPYFHRCIWYCYFTAQPVSHSHIILALLYLSYYTNCIIYATLSISPDRWYYSSSCHLGIISRRSQRLPCQGIFRGLLSQGIFLNLMNDPFATYDIDTVWLLPWNHILYIRIPQTWLPITTVCTPS